MCSIFWYSLNILALSFGSCLLLVNSLVLLKVRLEQPYCRANFAPLLRQYHPDALCITKFLPVDWWRANYSWSSVITGSVLAEAFQSFLFPPVSESLFPCMGWADLCQRLEGIRNKSLELSLNASLSCLGRSALFYNLSCKLLATLVNCLRNARTPLSRLGSLHCDLETLPGSRPSCCRAHLTWLPSLGDCPLLLSSAVWKPLFHIFYLLFF